MKASATSSRISIKSGLSMRKATPRPSPITESSRAAGAGPAQAAAGNSAAIGSTTQGLNGTVPPAAAARPADQDAIDLLGVAGVPVLKRALPAVGVLVGLLLLLVLRSRRKRRRAAAE